MSMPLVGELLVVGEDGGDGVGEEFFAAAEEGEFDEEGDADEVRAELVEEFDGGGGGATGGEEVIDEEDFFAGGDGVFVEFDDGFAVFEGVGDLAGFPGEFAFFADGDEAGAEAVGDGGGEDEAAGIDADDFVDFDAACGIAEEGDGVAEEGGIGEDGGDVFEDDSGFGEVDDIADGGAEEGGVWHDAGRVSRRGAGRRMGKSGWINDFSGG